MRVNKVCYFTNFVKCDPKGKWIKAKQCTAWTNVSYLKSSADSGGYDLSHPFLNKSAPFRKRQDAQLKQHSASLEQTTVWKKRKTLMFLFSENHILSRWNLQLQVDMKSLVRIYPFLHVLWRVLAGYWECKGGYIPRGLYANMWRNKPPDFALCSPSDQASASKAHPAAD